MEKYFDSNRIKVFPCAYRGQKSESLIFDPEARLSSEFNLTRISRNKKYAPVAGTKEQDSYIISWTPETAGENPTYTLACTISGYYFEISGCTLSEFVNGGKVLDLYIKVSDTAIISELKTPILTSFDGDKALDNTSNKFTGLLLADSGTKIDSATGKLRIVRLNGTTPELDESSYLPEIYSGTKQGEVSIGHFSNQLDKYLEIKSNEVNVTGDLNVNANKTFSVESSSGNTNIKGTLDVAGESSIANTLNSKSLNVGEDYTKFKVNTSGQIITDVVNTTGNLEALKTIGTNKYGLSVQFHQGTAEQDPTSSKTTVEGNLTVKKQTRLVENATLSTGANLYILEQKVPSGTTDWALKIDDEGKVIKNDLSAENCTDDTAKRTRFVYQISQGTDGKVSYKTDHFTIDNKDKQGSIYLNDNEIAIKDLGTTGTPTFESVKVKSIFGNTNDVGQLNIYTDKIATDIDAATPAVTINQNDLAASSIYAGTLEINGGIKVTKDSYFASPIGIGITEGTTDEVATTISSYGINSSGSQIRLAGRLSGPSSTGIGDHRLELGSDYVNGNTKDNGILEIHDNAKITFKVNADAIEVNNKLQLHTANGIYAKKDWTEAKDATAYFKIYGSDADKPVINIWDNDISTTSEKATLMVQGGAKLENDLICSADIITKNVDIKYESETASDTAVLNIGGGDSDNCVAGKISLYKSGKRTGDGAETIKLIGDSGEITASGVITSKTSFVANIATGKAFKLANNKFSVDVGGDAVGNTFTATSFIATSDKRLKENLVEYKSKKSILDLPIYKYDYINGSKNKIGCMAQDLQEICPEIVHENENGYLAIEESKIVYLLLDEVKKLKKEIEDLKNK